MLRPAGKRPVRELRVGGPVSWYDWLRNLWGSREPLEPGRPVGEPTEDHPAVPTLSLAAGGVELHVGVVSETGTVREHNEDNFFVPGQIGLTTSTGVNSTRPGVLPEIAGPTGLFIVADGMGGQNAGEKASEMAVSIVPSHLYRRLTTEDGEMTVKRAIRDAVVEANQEILAQSHLIAEFANMGTTIVLAFFRGDRVFITGIGDSRAYRLRDNRFERLTEDHSLADALEKAGTIRPEEVENHKFRNVLYLYLGCKDARDGPEEIRTLDVRRGDVFLLATDGLTRSSATRSSREVLLTVVRSPAPPVPWSIVPSRIGLGTTSPVSSYEFNSQVRVLGNGDLLVGRPGTGLAPSDLGPARDIDCGRLTTDSTLPDDAMPRRLDDFLTDIVRSGLVPATVVETARAGLPADDLAAPDASTRLARRLIGQGR